METLLSISQAAEILGIPKHTLAGWVSKRRVAYVKVGRRTLFNPADLDRMIRDNTVEPKPKREGK